MNGQLPNADSAPENEAHDTDLNEAALAESSEPSAGDGTEDGGADDDGGHAGDAAHAADASDVAVESSEVVENGETAGETATGDGGALGGDASSAGDAAGGGEHPERPRKPRRERPKRDPYETPFGGIFLDTLQRLAGLRGQFAYGVPEKLWRANREQTIRILREEVPMPTFKNQIHCILNSDPEWLAYDVHYEMLSSATPPEDSFRWLWLYMMLR